MWDNTLFAALLESAPDAMVIVEQGGDIVFVNAQTERLFGYSRDELLGNSVDMLVPKPYRLRHEGHRAAYVHDPRARSMGAGLELFGSRKDGSQFPAEISLSPIETERGLLISSAIRDISGRKRLERTLREKNAQLEAANLAKDRFLATMSHELRTPLNAIIGFAGTLLMKLPGPLTQEQEQQLEIIRSSGRHLLSLINDLLDIGKIESGKIEIKRDDVVVQQVVDEVATALRSMAEEKGLGFEISLPAQEIVLRTDRRALHQIVTNLVSNAVKYTEHGLIRVRVGESLADAGSLDIAVSDTGVGIKAEDQSRLFQAFEQLDVSTTRRYEGTGLGLYLSHKLALLLSGRVHFQSEFGKGSTFTLTLPISP